MTLLASLLVFVTYEPVNKDSSLPCADATIQMATTTVVNKPQEAECTSLCVVTIIAVGGGLILYIIAVIIFMMFNNGKLCQKRRRREMNGIIPADIDNPPPPYTP